MRPVVLILLLVPQICLSKNYEIFGVDEGLTQSVVNSLLVDRNGLVWIGTQNGLNCYDGYTFRHYRHKHDDTTFLTDGFVSALAEDTSGRIWVGTRQGINVIDPETGIINHYTTDKGEFRLPENWVRRLTIDKRNNLWVLTRKYLLSYNINNGVSSTYEWACSGANQKLSLVRISDTGRVYFACGNTIFTIQENKLQPFVYEEFTEGINDLEINDQGHLIVFSGKKSAILSPDLRLEEIIDQNKAIYFVHFHGEQFYAFNDTGIYTSNNGEFEPVAPINTQLQKVFKLGIRSFAVDRNKIAWVGTDGMGLVKLNLRSTKITTISPSEHLPGSIFDDQTMSVLSVNDMLISSGYTYGLFIYNRKNGECKHIDIEKETVGRKSNRVYHLSQIDQFIWVFTSKGLVFLDSTFRVINALEHYPFLNEFVNEREQATYATLKINNIGYFATDRGLYAIDFAKKNNYLDKNVDSILKTSQRYIFDVVGNDSILFLATVSGLIRYNLHTNELNNLSLVKDQRQGINNNTIYRLFLTDNSELWVGTTCGLFLFRNPFDNGPTPHRLMEMTERVIFSIETDTKKNLWIGTDFGLYRLSTINNEIQKFGKEDGLKSMEFNLAGSTIENSGTLAFGTQGGVSFFNPERIVLNQFNPALLLSGITITGSRGIRQFSQTSLDFLTIYPDEYMVKIAFSSVDLTFPNKNKYRYKLGSGEWIDIGSQNFVSFINLQPGEYDLYINGTNADQVWSTNVLKIKFKVLSPWYRTMYAYILYAGLFLLFIWRIFEARLRKLRRMNQILKEKESVAKEVARQKDVLAVLNRNMTDSIRYAHRIQRALFPDELRVRSLFPESFVMYRPKDIVSGDFYWVHDFGDNRFCIAAVDCTGHGVPGALMSVIGVKLLQEIIVQNDIDRPGDILQQLDFKVCTLFKNHHEEYFLAEGMDLSLCIFDKNVRTLQYAGAINSIYHVHGGNLKEIKADRMPVGISDVPNGFNYTNHDISYQSGDVFYLFTDGYIDQFGGQNEQKFKHSRFKEFLASFKSDNMDMQQAMLENNFDRWRGKSEQVDDVLVIGIRMG